MLSKGLSQSFTERISLGLRLLKLSGKKNHIYHMSCIGPNFESYSMYPMQASQQGSFAYAGGCWAESIVRLMRVMDGSTEMTMRNTKYSLGLSHLQNVIQNLQLHKKPNKFFLGHFIFKD